MLSQRIIIPLPSSTRLLMRVQPMIFSLSWMDSLGITKSGFARKISIRPHLPHHGAPLLIRSCLLGSKTLGTTFQRAMSYAFYDLEHIILAFLDDLIA